MTELLVVLGLSLLGLVLAAHAARSVMSAPVGTAEMNRAANLVREAAEGFARAQSGVTAALSALFGGGLFLAFGLRTAKPSDPISALELGVWTTISFAVGAASTILLGQLTTTLTARSAVRVASAAQRTLDESLRLALRTGSATALLTGATSSLGLSALVLAILVQRGVLGPNAGAAMSVVPKLPLLIAGHALGACFAAMFGQLSGGAFAAGADVGADVGGREAGLSDDSPDNPAVVVDLAGDCAGEAANRCTAGFAAAAVADLAAMSAGALAYAANPALPSALALVALPLVARGFGVVGSAFGALVVRTDERESAAAPLYRGAAISIAMHAFGLAGAAKWLLPNHWDLVAACGAVGLLGALLVLWSVRRAAAAASPAVRQLAESSRGGPTHSVLGGLRLGLDLAAGAALIAIATGVGADALAVHLGGPSAVPLGVGAAVLGFVGCSTYLLAIDVSSAQADLALGLVRMTVGADRPEVGGRLLLLDVDGTAHRAMTRAHAAAVAALAGVLLVRALEGEAERRGLAPSGVRPLALAVAVTGGLGLVAWTAARATAGAARGARRVLEEVRRQLRDRAPMGAEEEPAARRPSMVPVRPRSPDYLPCVEMSSRFALRQALLPSLLAAGLPLAVVLALRLGSDGDKGSVVGSVAAFAVTTIVAGVFVTLATSSAGAAFSNAKKYIVTGAHGGRLLVDESGARAENPTYHAIVVGDTVGDPLKGAAAPALLLLSLLVPALFLVLLPFLH